ncbi:MAG: hypothetical protein DYH06_22950 [Acidobacteria bacterium ACB2]|nr:hypothetical protein [Acidobacteria bacterium ACB2]
MGLPVRCRSRSAAVVRRCGLPVRSIVPAAKPPDASRETMALVVFEDVAFDVTVIAWPTRDAVIPFVPVRVRAPVPPARLVTTEPVWEESGT